MTMTKSEWMRRAGLELRTHKTSKEERKQQRAELTARICVCRFCREEYIGHGALCNKQSCQTEAGIEYAIENINADHAETKTTRAEWREIV